MQPLSRKQQAAAIATGHAGGGQGFAQLVSPGKKQAHYCSWASVGQFHFPCFSAPAIAQADIAVYFDSPFGDDYQALPRFAGSGRRQADDIAVNMHIASAVYIQIGLQR